ncbi:IQ calmodulin-binding motif [Musa troglodytarum]|uniref:IQ calmodulin-binding motif n=1 Tax=Musa troglodytarum TaxID=320322 RepID=A0A9E7HTW6_9LILI|nr:IQ calmodulin-binding motif [Musa troglodytarum]
MNETKNQAMNETTAVAVRDPKLSRCLPGLSSPRPLSEPDAAAARLQRIYRSLCGSRRNRSDCAVVVDELWSVSTAATFCFCWICVCVLPLQEASLMSLDWWQVEGVRFCVSEALLCIDPRHRYGHNLQSYYDVWFESESSQPFFYWLDVGDGRATNLDKCPRSNLQDQRIRYLGPREREAYEVIVEDGRLVYRESGLPVSTVEGSKWIFVLSTSRALYVGQKRKGNFHHSSFLAGGAATAAGRLVAAGGALKAIWPYSGHYLPTAENFEEFIVFLRDNNVDLSNVKVYSYFHL